MKSPLRFPSSIFICLLGSACSLRAGTVTTAIDDPTPGSGSLRAVLAAAVNGETIDFAPSLNGALITLAHGELAISGLTVTIDADSLPAGIAISGNNLSRILNISLASNVTLNHLTLQNGRQDNVTFGNGGAIEAVGGALTMSDCVIKDCYATRDGGGLNLKGISLQMTMDRCSIVGNQTGTSGLGGGIFLGESSATITNTVISGNRSLQGGGIFGFGSSQTLINCTIQGNAGEGLRTDAPFSSSLSTVRNCIIWGNRVGNGSFANQQITTGSNSTANVDFSWIEGRAASANNLSGTNPLDTPEFVAPAQPANSPISTSDVRLHVNSTSINAGNNAAITQPLDRAGFPRFQESSVDMGAFENGYVTFATLHPTLFQDGDENQNGISNYEEYALGIDPAGTETFSALPALTTSGGFRLLTSSRRINGLDVSASWTTSTTLQPLSWQPMVPSLNFLVDSTTILAPGRQQLIFKLLDSDPSRFYRQGFSTGN